MEKALSNITVLDLTRVLAGPYCTMMLADYGANVIKIEMPGKGDDTRAMGPKKNDYSMYYAYVNRGKKGITLNLKSEEGKKLFLEMVKKADVVVENYRPGVMDKLGVGYDVLKEVNDQIIYAAVSGFGCYGPKHQRPGYDIIAQATSGLMSITGEAGGQPLRVAMPWATCSAAEPHHRHPHGAQRPHRHRPRPARGRRARRLRRLQP